MDQAKPHLHIVYPIALVCGWSGGGTDAYTEHQIPETVDHILLDCSKYSQL